VNPDDPWVDDDDEPYPARLRGRRRLMKAIALVLIVGLLLAFPLGYLLDAELRNQHLEAALALIELTVAAVLVGVVRSSRRPL
jgi:high-affinity Fe2+/Pb2+ permease